MKALESKTSRILILGGLVLLGSGLLVARLYDFQIKRRDEFAAQIPKPTKVTTRIPGVRGRILDRNGMILASNRPSYEVDINLKTLADAYAAQYSDDPTETIVRYDAQGMLREHSRQDIVKIMNDFLVPRLETYRLASNYHAASLRNHFSTHGGLVPFTYREDLSFEEFTKFAEHQLEFPGVEVSVRGRREYPFGCLASHVLGYVKRWEKGKVPAADKALFDHFVGDDEGVAGIEKTMDSALSGIPGKKVWLRDERGRFVNIIEQTEPASGADVQLTLDAGLQYLVESQLRRIGRGAAVVMNVRTGEVLAMASVPDFDPNDFIPSISQMRFDSYRRNPAQPFTNRALTAYEPGSTFKIPAAACGCHHGKLNTQYHCSGGVQYGEKFMRCWIHAQGGSHGTIGLKEALQRSCNSYFYLLANQLGPASMVSDMQAFGFGQRTGIELPDESPGILPGSSWWQRQNPKARMTPALTAQLAIGQGDTQATPLQLCNFVSAVANGGKLLTPRLILQYQEQDAKEPTRTDTVIQSDLLKMGFTAESLAAIREGMRWAVAKPGGTASAAGLEGIQVCAKTGTAQTIDNGKASHNAWTVAFAPYENPEYAICIMVRGGESGGKVAAPLVGAIFRGLFTKGLLPVPGDPLPPYAGDLDTVVSVDSKSDQVERIKRPRAVAIVVEDAVDSLPNDRRGVLAEPRIAPARPSVRPEADSEGSVVRPREMRRRSTRPRPSLDNSPVRPQARKAIIVEPETPTTTRRAVPVE